MIANGEFNDWDDESKRYDIIRLIREGIPYLDFLGLFENHPFTDKEWASYLGISQRTLDRYKGGAKNFPIKQSERILEIKRLLDFGTAVFEDYDNLMQWMQTKNIPLGGVVPKSLLDTTLGINIVYDQLGRIEHGILA